MIDSAEPIARVISDLRRGRFVSHVDSDLADELRPEDMGPVVDATGIYESLVAKDDPIAIYEDHPCITPPWESAAICYVNEHGNVLVMAAFAFDARKDGPFGLGDLAVADGEGPYQPRYWKTAEPLDWSQVRWILNTWVFVGGRSDSIPGPLPTRGPVHAWQFAIAENGAFRYPEGHDPLLGDGAALKAAYEYMQARATKPPPEEGSTLQRYDGGES